MTTKNKTYTFIEDISKPNSLINFGFVENVHLSASLWLSTRTSDVNDARLYCLSWALARVKDEFPSVQFWLIVSQKAIQSDSRISMYSKLWKYLERQGIGLPPEESIEQRVNSKSGLRFCGAARFSLSEVGWAHQIMSRERASVLIVHSNEAEAAMKELIRCGEVVQESLPASELLKLCEKHDITLLDVFGEFDDPEIVVTIIGKRQMIEAERMAHI